MLLLRRFVLLCLLLCLPLQGGWAAALERCPQDRPCPSQHAHPATTPAPDVDAGEDRESPAATSALADASTADRCAGDCVNCLGHHAPALLGRLSPMPEGERATGLSPYHRHITHPAPKPDLRPPTSPQR